MDWIGSALIISAWFLLSHKRRCGFLFNVAGSILWVWWAVNHQQTSVAVICGFYVVAGLYGWFKWGKKQ